MVAKGLKSFNCFLILKAFNFARKILSYAEKKTWLLKFFVFLAKNTVNLIVIKCLKKEVKLIDNFLLLF